MPNSARGHRTQWAAQFAVASELCKRGYEVSFTLGRTTPVADLIAITPDKRTTFYVDVKGLWRKNSWLVKRKPKRDRLFYILAYVPDDGPNEFFILAQGLVTDYIKRELKRLRRPDDYRVTGIPWKLAASHDDWKVLPR